MRAKRMNKNLLIAVVVVTIFAASGIGYAAVHSSNNKKATEHSAMMMKEAEDAKMKKDKVADSQLSPADTAMEKTHEADTMVKGSYSDYDLAKLANAERGKVVLFFHAPWCPTCREADNNFKASAAPEGLTLLKTDYDSSNDLKKRYGVTYQHTYVQVDKNGDLIKKWSGSTTYDQLEKQLN